ncbi:MAG: FapA family protein [Clostridium sp.]|nr:FapA family protein [Clostridium sp.]
MSGLFKGVSNYIDSYFGNRSGNQDGKNDGIDRVQQESAHNDKENTVVSSEMEKSGQGVRVKDRVIEIRGSGNITPCRGIDLYINDNICSSLVSYKVNENDKIEYKILQSDEVREVYVEASKDKMQGFVSIQYKGKGDIILKDTSWSDNLFLKCDTTSDDAVEKYNMFDVKDILKKNNIVKGIDEEKLKRACENGTKGQYIEVAHGREPVDDIPSTLKILFDIGQKDIEIDSTIQKIDYKNVYSIVNVEAGDVLAEIIPRVDGSNGFDVSGEEIKRKIAANRPIKVGGGCKIENNKIIAAKNGRPSSKNGVISVNSIYKVDNVDIKSGNIKFIGDVEVDNGVSEGMAINAGNSVLINKDIESAAISAGGEINIKGNILKSKVTTGQIDVDKKLYVDNLKKLSSEIKTMLECSEELMQRTNMEMSFTEVAKVLIENKFRNIPKLSSSIIGQSFTLEVEDHEIMSFMKNKIIGINISNIKDEQELIDFEDMLKNEIDFYEDDMIIQSDINISYCQDSLIKSTGRIVVTGKGTYVSDIIALNEVEFVHKDAVARGGKISSLKSVMLGTVGSPAGVRTVVAVPENGVITAETAYVNTQFCFGKKSKILDSDCRNVKAYIDEFGDIEIENLKL